MLRWLLALIHSRRGSVSVLAAVICPTLIGMAGLAAEYGDALLTKVKATVAFDVPLGLSKLINSISSASHKVRG